MCVRPDGGKKRDMLFLGFAFGLLLLRPIHPEHVSGDFAGVGPRWARCPPVQSLVTVQHDTNMLRLVSVPGGIGISEAQLATKRFDVVGFPGQEQPAWLDPVASGVIARSEEHTSELQSLAYLVCRLLLEKKKQELTHDKLRRIQP